VVSELPRLGTLGSRNPRRAVESARADDAGFRRVGGDVTDLTLKQEMNHV